MDALFEPPKKKPLSAGLITGFVNFFKTLWHHQAQYFQATYNKSEQHYCGNSACCSDDAPNILNHEIHFSVTFLATVE
jgi:hypothetical protein